MRRHRRAAVCAAVVLSLATTVLLAPSAGARSAAQSTKEQPKATEIGVTPTTIRIAVIADVNTPLAPGSSSPSADARPGVGASTSTRTAGSRAARSQVDFIDSKLSPDETRNAIIQACAEDFAMVGTTALFLNNVDDMMACKDQAGAGDGPARRPRARHRPDPRPGDDVVPDDHLGARAVGPDATRPGRSAPVSSSGSSRTSTRTSTARSVPRRT